MNAGGQSGVWRIKWCGRILSRAGVAARGLMWIRHGLGVVSGVSCQIRVVGSVHFSPVTRIKTLRTPNKSGL